MFINVLLPFKKICATTALLLCFFAAQAQLATYPMRTGGGNPAGGQPLPAGTNANITALNTNVGSEITNQPNGTYNSSGLRVRPNNLAWPTAISNSFCVNIPLAPKANYDFKLISVTFKNNQLDGNPNLWCQLAYQVNGAGAWNYIGTQQAVTAANLGTTITIGGLNEGFYNGATYVFRFYFYGNGANDKSQGFRMSDLVFNGVMISPPAVKPTVHTTSLSPFSKYFLTAQGNFDTGAGFRITNKAGFLSSLNATPVFANSGVIYAATATSPLNETIGGLTPATTYYVRAFAITQADTILAPEILTATTFPYSEPLLNTTAPSNILSNKATSGGNLIDSGGYGVLEKGVLFATSSNNLIYPPVLPVQKTSDGIGNADYLSILKNLTPNTKYYVVAYARNSMGVGYGGLDSFTTGAPVPSIVATPSNLDFGEVTFNTAPSILSYKVNASYLTPASGSVVLYSSNGYTIATTLNGVYNDTLPLSYTGSTITNKIIYVKSSSTPYGTLPGKILHTGGGTVAPNADTTFLTTTVVQNADTLSNAGSDFWCGFGYQAKMDQAAGDPSEAKLSIYVTTGNQPATVHVDLSSGGYSQTQLIPANSYFEFKNFPTGDANELNPNGLPDSRLYVTGKTKRAIHIYTDDGVPVSAFMHSYTVNNTAAGAMLFPTNTWNSSYVVQTLGAQSNSSNPNAYFFVIANQDNTPVTFTPKNDIVDSTSNTVFNDQHTAADIKYKKDSTYTITLNKGEVFNAMGYITGTGSGVGTGKATGLDLSGTLVKTTCDKRITVFAGNGRSLINTSACVNLSQGSDHLIQQMFPSVAWGTKYLTMPTKGQQYNYFRIYIQNPVLFGTTKVWVNNPTHTTPLTGLINNLYYEYTSNQPILIESDKPINVTQFITTPGCVAPSVDGGPEMIMLSPIQQAITNATVFSPGGKCVDSRQTNIAGTTGNYGNFINVIIPTSAVSTFKLDNSNLVDTGKAITACGLGSAPAACVAMQANGTKINVVNAFRKHPQDTSYSIANFWVFAPQAHTMSAAKGFNSIAYGMGAGESYGYNAGTTINNLSAIKFSLNPYGNDTSTASVKTCKGNLVTLQIALPYDTSTVNSIIWDAGSDATRYSPTGPQAGAINSNTSKPVVTGTIVRDGRTFYIYKSPVQYTFFEEGAYKVKVTVNGTFISDCGGTDIQYMNVVVGHDDISFTAIPAGCGSKNVTITDASTPLAGTSIVKWNWDFGDNTKDSATIGDSWAPNPKVNPHTYPNNNAYYIKLTTINSVGCFSYDSVLVDLAFGINTSFTSFRDTACVGESVVFTPTSSANAVKWFWDFGDASPIDSTNAAPNAVTHSYTSAGTYTISHWVKTSAGCPSTIVKDTVVVTKTPVASFVTPSGVCLPGNTQFTNSSDTNAVGAAVPYTYHWSFGTGNAADTSNVKNPVFSYSVAPPNAVTLVATSRFGCVSTVYSQSVSNVYTKPTAAIANTSSKKVCVGSNASFFDASSGTNQTVNSWYWKFGDGGTAISQNPQHIYTTNATYTVKLAIGTDKGCVSDTTTWVIKVNPKPVAGTILPSSCISSGALLFQDNSIVAVDDSIQTPYTWTWNFGDGTGTFTTEDSTHTYATIGTYYVTHTITTLNGCTDTKKDTFTIEGTKPVTGFEVVNRTSLCSNVPVSIIDTSRVAIGTIKKVQIRWDIYNDFTLMDTDLSPSNGATGTSKTYNHKYPYLPNTRTYWIRFYTYSGANCVDSLDKSLTVYGSPKAIFDTLRGVCLDGTPRKINLATDSSGRFSNSLFGTWKYTGPSVVNDTFYPSIAGAGIHYIKVVYTSKVPLAGCRDSALAPIAVWALPTPSFTTTTPLCEGTNVTFTDNSTPSAGSGNIGAWLWNFGDAASGTKDTSTQKSPTHNYSAYNTYNVSLKVTSDSGCSATLTPPQAVVVHPRPKVGFIVPPGVCSGTAVGFTDTSKIADNSESQFTHFWNFGDNITATGTPLANTSHLYAAPPTDSVRLIVTSKDGCKDSLVVKLSSVVFPQQAPVLSANGKTVGANDTVKVCVGNSILFRNMNVPAANQGYWEFGDTASVVNIGKTIPHTYPNATVYTGKHYADDNNGCRTTTANFNVLIWSLPTPIISVSNPTCEKNAITFTDVSAASAGTGNIKSWLWKFGEPSSNALDSAKTQIASHIYGGAGAYNVYLTVTSDSGCKATSPVATVVNVHPNPKVKFGIPTAVCLPLAAQFTDSSMIADGSEAQFTHTWNFGETSSGAANTATGSPLTTTSHLYATSNNYSIKLIVKSKDGCIDSSLNTLSASAIHNRPTSNYAVNTPSHDTPRVCLGTPISFKDSSGSNVATSYWIWGDEGLTTYLGKIPPPHLFTPSGTFYGIHFIDDNNGCRSDTSEFITIIDSFPVVKGGEKYLLAGTSAILTPYISGGDSYLWTPVIPNNPVDDYLDFNDVENPLYTALLDSVVYRLDVAAGVCAAAPVYYTVKTFTAPVIPNAFSPNGDGINDTWDIASLKFFTGSSVQVFNRYGQLVFTSLGYTRNWNGTDISGSPLPMGVYYYIIKPGFGLPMVNGSLTILR